MRSVLHAHPRLTTALAFGLVAMPVTYLLIRGNSSNDLAAAVISGAGHGIAGLIRGGRVWQTSRKPAALYKVLAQGALVSLLYLALLLTAVLLLLGMHQLSPRTTWGPAAELPFAGILLYTLTGWVLIPACAVVGWLLSLAARPGQLPPVTVSD